MDSSPKRYSDLHSAKLVEIALINNEGYLADNGALCVETGERKGRSPQDQFIVNECSTNDLIDWGDTNKPFSPEGFSALWRKVEDTIFQSDHYVSHLEVGDHPNYYIPIEITTQTAWHNLFARNIFICSEQFNAKGKKKWRVLHAPNFTCNPEHDGTRSDAAVIINFAKRKVLIAGMHYAGELKKALFTVQNFLLLEKDVLPLHCAANVGEDGDVSLLFGLSGTGKTTLATTPKRYLIGDDEHGWGKETVFNLEGGCYAKTAKLSQEQDPEIWNAIRFGTIVENIVHNTYTRAPNYTDIYLGENSRSCYPLDYIHKSLQPARSGEPNTIILLACDTLGVLPAVSKLTPEAAAYYFLSGYTAQIGSTEIGNDNSIQPIFSACFGAAFLPRPAQKYAKLLLKRLEEFDCNVYMVNTGWYGGAAESDSGERFPLNATREIIRAIQSGTLEQCEYETLDTLNLSIPTSIPNFEIESRTLNPKNAWANKEEYNTQAQRLAQLFSQNIAQYHISNKVIAAGPLA